MKHCDIVVIQTPPPCTASCGRKCNSNKKSFFISRHYSVGRRRKKKKHRKSECEKRRGRRKERTEAKEGGRKRRREKLNLSNFETSQSCTREDSSIWFFCALLPLLSLGGPQDPIRNCLSSLSIPLLPQGSISAGEKAPGPPGAGPPSLSWLLR